MSKVIPGVDDSQAQYWNGPVSRSEIQDVFDDYTKQIIELRTQLMNLDFAVAFLMEKFQVVPKDIEEFAAKKMIELLEAKKTAN